MECPHGLRRSKSGHCVKRCPKGTRKKKGECVPRDPMIFCPPGFHQSNGKCIRKKCPDGTIRKKGVFITPDKCKPCEYKNHLGRCVKDLNFSKIEEDLTATLRRIEENPTLSKQLKEAIQKYEKDIIMISRDYTLP